MKTKGLSLILNKTESILDSVFLHHKTAILVLETIIQRSYSHMRSPNVLLIGSVITDIVLIIYLFTLIDEIGIGLVILLSALLLGGTFLTYKLMSRI